MKCPNCDSKAVCFENSMGTCLECKFRSLETDLCWSGGIKYEYPGWTIKPETYITCEL